MFSNANVASLIVLTLKRTVPTRFALCFVQVKQHTLCRSVYIDLQCLPDHTLGMYAIASTCKFGSLALLDSWLWLCCACLSRFTCNSPQLKILVFEGVCLEDCCWRLLTTTSWCFTCRLFPVQIILLYLLWQVCLPTCLIYYKQCLIEHGLIETICWLHSPWIKFTSYVVWLAWPY